MNLPRIRQSFLGSWLAFSVVLSGLILTWSVATPLPSGPDETAHYVEAAAVVRGQVAGTQVQGKPGLTKVRVPASIARQGSGRGCYYRPSSSAACDAAAPTLPRVSVDAVTYVGNYPPLYYALTGWPSLLSQSRTGLHAMRAVSAVLGGILLGLAFATVRRWSENRLLPLGLALALTPAAIYLSSVLNPSGFEITLAAVLWTSAGILVLERADSPPAGLVAVVTASATLSAFTRPLSPLFVLLILGGLALLRPRRCRLLLRARAARIGAVVVGVAVSAAAIFVLTQQSYIVEKFPLPAGISTAEVVRLAVAHAASVTKQLFGGYGSPNFGSPFFVQMLWGGSAMLLVGLALLLLPRRDALLLAIGLVLVLLVLPLVVDLSGARTRGLVWQGRYELPLAVGFPLLAAGLLASRRPDGSRRSVDSRQEVGRAHLLGPVVVALGLLVAYFWVVRRYQLGLAGPLNPFPSGPGVWQPPVSGVLLFVLAAALTAAYALLVHRSSRPVPDAALPDAPPPDTSPPDAAEPVAAETTTGSATA